MSKNSLKQPSLNRLIEQSLAIEAEEAKNAGALGFMSRALVQATMPHKNPNTNEFERTNGMFTLSMLAPQKVGLPYGNIPRLLMTWITTEAVRTKERGLILGSSLSDFMKQLNLTPTGGRWGSITRLREQMKKLFASSVKCIYDNKKGYWATKGIELVETAQLWWDPKEPDQATMWESSLVLSPNFFKELIEHPVPVDMRAIKALQQSSISLDIYCWLTYRMSYLNKQTQIPWGTLQAQFGSDYSRTRDFKRKFLEHLKSVLVVYPEAKVSEGEYGLCLRPSKPHILK